MHAASAMSATKRKVVRIVEEAFGLGCGSEGAAWRGGVRLRARAEVRTQSSGGGLCPQVFERKRYTFDVALHNDGVVPDPPSVLFV